ncbi:hypothetical protein BDD12DRAFT_45358 [Trichophaea hybrida]|nr:hypothetical protein BDD12DRAFT_45358 [Trichophaea hybrida]
MDRSILLLSRHTLAMSTTRSQRRGQNYDRKRTRRARSWLTATTAAFALSGITGASARDIVYCSDVNTGSDSSPNTSTYQSNGLCYDTCNAGSYAFAILQGQDCWCSNYVPATDASGCNDPCPGYPSDTCGNMQKNLYGYMALPNKPSGTKGADTTVSTTSPHPITSTVTAKGPTETMIIVWLVPSCTCWICLERNSLFY